MPLQDKLPHPILPDGTRNEIQARESYHLLKIMSEFVEAGEELRAIYPAVSIYGSARTPVNHPDYLLAELIARRLSDAGFAVISGGGPGIMEAANKGAFAGRSPAVGPAPIRRPAARRARGRTPRAPARARLPLLPSGPGGVHRMTPHEGPEPSVPDSVPAPRRLMR